jgi:hypothetical protein
MDNIGRSLHNESVRRLLRPLHKEVNLNSRRAAVMADTKRLVNRQTYWGVYVSVDATLPLGMRRRRAMMP